MKSSFLGHEKPLLTMMLEMGDLEDVIRQIEEGISEGADAFGVELNRTPVQLLNEQSLRCIFAPAGNRPIYVTCYPKGTTEGLTDEEREALLITAVKAGATLADVTGGWYDPENPEFSEKPDVVEKQKALVNRLHEAGAEVLMSSHFYTFLPKERILYIAEQQKARGADVVKLVTWTSSRRELAENLSSTLALKEAGYTFLFASNGPWCRLHRALAPALGEDVVLVTRRHAPGTSQVQPLLRDAGKALEVLPWQPPSAKELSMDMETYKY